MAEWRYVLLVLVLVLVLLLMMLLMMMLLRLHHVVGYIHSELADGRGNVNSGMTYSSRKLRRRTHVIGRHLLMLPLLAGPLVLGDIHSHLNHIDNIRDAALHHQA